jgi:hypothetical protein
MKAVRGLGPGTCLRDAGPYLFGGSGVKQPTVGSSENRCLELGSHPALALKSTFAVAKKGRKAWLQSGTSVDCVGKPTTGFRRMANKVAK